MKFIDWCKLDPNDSRKIDYKFYTLNHNIMHFTSEDIVSYDMIKRIRNANIAYAEIRKNVWHIILKENY